MGVGLGRLAVVGFLLASTVLAGCSGDSGGGPTTSGTSASCAEPCDVVREGTQAPGLWAIGDWWNFTATAQARSSFSHVVTEDLGEEWFMDTDNPSSAFRNAIDDTSYLGPIRKADLAGSQKELRIAYLAWPLEEGKTWSTRWDGLEMTLRGRFIEDRGSALVPKAPWAYFVEAHNPNGTLYASYSYIPTASWFRNVTFHGPGGLPEFGFELTRFGHAYPGTVVRWRLSTVVEWSASFGFQGTNWALPANATDVYASWRFTCTSGAIAVRFGRMSSPDGAAGHGVEGQCPLDDRGSGVLGVPAPPAAGDDPWGAVVAGAPGTVGDYELTIWIRYADVFPVGDAAASGAAPSGGAAAGVTTAG